MDAPKNIPRQLAGSRQDLEAGANGLPAKRPRAETALLHRAACLGSADERDTISRLTADLPCP